MLKKACCYLCLNVNKRNINIYKTDLQYVYEKLAEIKVIDDECWMCYICLRRLQQCLRLQQLAKQTRGLIKDIGQNKINIEFGGIVSLLELSISKTKFVSLHPTLNDVKQESDVNAGPSNYYEIHQDDNVQEYTVSNEKENVKSTIKCEISLVKEEYFENIEENTAIYADKPNLEMKIEIENTNIQQADEQEYSNDCEERDHTDVQLGRYNKPLTCEVCSKTFRFLSQLQRHVKAHTGDKPHVCEICSKKFADKNNLKKHKQTHTGEKPFNCDICSKKFMQRSALTKHTRVHTGEKPFTCDVCSKSFSVKQSLENHIRIHTGDKPFSCDICSMKFIERSTLLNHTKTHTGEKPFMCDICSKKFSMRAALNNHIRTHTGDKPFSCNICSKRFSRSSHLYRHKKIHMRDKP